MHKLGIWKIKLPPRSEFLHSPGAIRKFVQSMYNIIYILNMYENSVEPIFW